MVTKIIRDGEFIGVAKRVKVDKKRRIVLPSSLVQDDVTFHIYANKAGQIVLDPQVTIPASELWVFENKEVLASLDKAMIESKNGQVVKRGSFAKYVNDKS
jgi:hypothetical protein